MSRRGVVTFAAFNGYRVRILEARNIETTGQRLHVDLSGACAAYVPHLRVIVFGFAPDAPTVAHEASHAIRAMLASVGVRNDDEIFAYHLDFLVGRIHRFLKKGTHATI